MNKKLIVFAILAIMLLIAGCGTIVTEETKEEVQDTEPVPEVKEAVKIDTPKVEVKEETTPAPEVVADEPEKTEKTVVIMPQELKDLINPADSRLKSYRYLYADASDERFLSTYFVKGTKMKIKLYEKDIYVKGKYFDTIYLDTSTKYTTARCEHKLKCFSDKNDYTKDIFPADFSDYIVKTPYEWVKEVLTGEIIGPEVMNGRTTTKILYEKDGNQAYMWIDDTYGLPAQVTVEDSSTGLISKWQFTDYEFNTIRNTEIVPAFGSNQY